MFSLQKFFGNDPKFFDLLEASANEARRGALALNTILADMKTSANLHEIRESRLKSKEIFEELSEMVVRTFVTALEREDIEALSNALYKILKPMEKFAERLLISNGLVKSTDFLAQSSVIQQATETVVEMVKEVRRVGNLEHVRKLNAKLQASETEADRLELELLRDLYKNTSSDPLRITVSKDLYDLLEKTIDRCRDVGNVVMHIVLKNS